jgi:hypothetical protein
MLVYCLAYSPNLKIKAKFSSETSVSFQQTARPYIPEDITLQNICTLQNDKPQRRTDLEEINMSP